MLRKAVTRRKLITGTESESRDRWMEQILSLTQTCRLQNKLPCPVLVPSVLVSGHKSLTVHCSRLLYEGYISYMCPNKLIKTDHKIVYIIYQPV